MVNAAKVKNILHIDKKILHFFSKKIENISKIRLKFCNFAHSKW